MIKVRLNDGYYRLDVHSLIRAFYPACDIDFISEYEDEADYNIIIDDENITINSCKSAISNVASNKRNAVKKLVYGYLSKETNTKLPWGDLTGVRPTKAPLEMLLSGSKCEDAIEFMKDEYLVSDEKAHLATQIAHSQLDIIKNASKDCYSIYIGIPFCPSRCMYCSFTSYPISAYEKNIKEYLDCLIKELEFIADSLKDKKLLSVYIGGGTPTSLDEASYEYLLSNIRRILNFTFVREFNVEAGRADSITPGKLESALRYGVSRISINPQTMNDKTLKTIGRHHSAKQVVEGFNLARSMGFDNINMDIIAGLFSEGIEEINNTLNAISELRPDSLTVHSLAVKRAALLDVKDDIYKSVCIDQMPQILSMCSECAYKMNMAPYYMYRQKNIAGNLENVGYSLPHKEGIYNIFMMEDVHNVIGAGAGAASKVLFGNGKIKRAVNVKDVALYISRISEMIDKKRKLLEEIKWL